MSSFLSLPRFSQDCMVKVKSRLALSHPRAGLTPMVKVTLLADPSPAFPVSSLLFRSTSVSLCLPCRAISTGLPCWPLERGAVLLGWDVWEAPAWVAVREHAIGEQHCKALEPCLAASASFSRAPVPSACRAATHPLIPPPHSPRARSWKRSGYQTNTPRCLTQPM